jgi:hypothetical protein
MNDFRLLLSLRAGTGTITVNGVAPVEFYTEGDVLTIAIALDNGFHDVKWYSSPNNTLISSAISFSYTMPSNDVKIYALAEGANVPINDYGLKYEGLYGTNYGGQCWNLRIFKDAYSGPVNELLINDITYSWGNKSDDVLSTIVGSSVDFTIAGETGDFNEFLEGGNRSWNVVLSRVGNNNDINNWQSVSLTQPYSRVAYGANRFFACLGNNRAYSSNGITWTEIFDANFFASDAVYGNYVFVAVGNDPITGNVQVRTSPNGITWTTRISSILNSEIQNIAYGNNLFVATAVDNANGQIMTSPNGTTWTTRSVSTNRRLNGAAYGNGIWVIVCSDSVGATGGSIITSYDGITWTVQSAVIYNFAIEFANGIFTTGTHYSYDGINWNTTGLTVSGFIDSITYGNGYFIAVNGNQILYSENGISWTSRSSVSNADLRGIAFAQNRFVSVGMLSKVNYLIFDGLDKFFSGYISPDFITSPFSSGKKLFSFTAIDGLKGLDSIRSNFSSWPSPRTAAVQALVGALNQSFIEQRETYMVCNVYETRMSTDNSVFEQFNIPANAIYTDGEYAKFSNNVFVQNEQLFLSETIERLVNPFLCKVFIWENRFYIMRIAEFDKTQMRYFQFYPDGRSVLPPGTEGYFGNLDDYDCGLNMPEQTAHRAYTEFNTYLNFGVLDRNSQGGVFDARFAIDEWNLNSSASPYPNIYQLKVWDYIRAIPSNQPTSVPSGNTALVQYVSGSEEYVQIWTTTTTAGIADPNISYISASTNTTGGAITIAEETANTISLSFQYMVERVSTSYAVTPGAHSVGVMVRIGNQYLSRTGATTFAWTGTSTIMEFSVTAGSVWNSIAISNVLVPVDGDVEIRLYQLICTGATPNRYVIRYENLSLKIEKTEGLALSKIGVKAITNLPYANVHPDYNTFIGDAITSNSVSAIQLIDSNNEVSELWSRDGVEELPLLDLISQELANLKGRPNLRLLTKFRRDYTFIPWVGYGFFNRHWIPISYELDLRSGNSSIEWYDLGEITT